MTDLKVRLSTAYDAGRSIRRSCLTCRHRRYGPPSGRVCPPRPCQRDDLLTHASVPLCCMPHWTAEEQTVDAWTYVSQAGDRLKTGEHIRLPPHAITATRRR